MVPRAGPSPVRASDLGVPAFREEREQAVEAFTAEFLLPRTRVRAVAGEDDASARRQALVRLAAVYRVSWSLAVARLGRTGLVDAEELRALRTRRPTDAEFRDAVGWKPQSELASVRVSPRYASAVMAAPRAERITPARAVEMMRGVSIEELTEEAADGIPPPHCCSMLPRCCTPPGRTVSTFSGICSADSSR